MGSKGDQPMKLPDNLREPKALAEQLRFLATWLYPEKPHSYITRDMSAAVCLEAANQLEAALAQQAQPEGAAWMQATCNNGGTGHLFMAYVRSGESIPHLCNEHNSQ